MVTGCGDPHSASHTGYLKRDDSDYVYATCNNRGIVFQFWGVSGASNCHVYKLQTTDGKWISWYGNPNWLAGGYGHGDAMPILFDKQAKRNMNGQTVYKMQHGNKAHWRIYHTEQDGVTMVQ
mmetsp:Transcript_49031/g.94777  ORF Transcript_49031/g.94777 Transcript_49031/m.94777 type:complete len:122 (-) Transcript_49031:205-570(-)